MVDRSQHGVAVATVLRGARLSRAHFSQVEVAMLSAIGLRPNPSPAPLKTFPCYAVQSVTLLRTVSARAPLLPCSAREGLQGGVPLPSKRGGGLRLKPCIPGQVFSHGSPGRLKIALCRAIAAPRPSAAGDCSSPARAVALGPSGPSLPCSRAGQVSRIAFGAIRSAKGEENRLFLPPSPSTHHS